MKSSARFGRLALPGGRSFFACRTKMRGIRMLASLVFAAAERYNTYTCGFSPALKPAAAYFEKRDGFSMEQFQFLDTEIPGVKVIEPNVHGDDRGYFVETYQKDLFAAAGIPAEFVQDNESRSTKGVLRGLHFQKNHTQGKLVRVTRGEVYDVAVDCRPGSQTFGKWVGVTLSAENKKMFYIPEGFAHGFLVLSDVAEFCYKCTDVYDPTGEGGIPYDDPTVNVQWPDCGCPHKTSPKDKEHAPFAAQDFAYFARYVHNA